MLISTIRAIVIMIYYTIALYYEIERNTTRDAHHTYVESIPQ